MEIVLAGTLDRMSGEAMYGAHSYNSSVHRRWQEDFCPGLYRRTQSQNINNREETVPPWRNAYVTFQRPRIIPLALPFPKYNRYKLFIFLESYAILIYYFISCNLSKLIF